MVRLALIALFPLHPVEAYALAGLVVTLPGPVPVTVALLAALGLDGVAKIPGLTSLTLKGFTLLFNF